MNVRTIYAHRFDRRESFEMRAIWRVLVRDFFQQFIHPDATVLDLGAGNCHFINAVRAARRIAFDANPDVRLHAEPGIEVLVSDDLRLSMIPDGSLTHVFVSNFLEHLPDTGTVIEVLSTLHRKLASNGSVLILQPNFRLLGAAYFDFIDHHAILTDRSLVEALHISGFSVAYQKTRFLPYTSKSRFPKQASFVRLYLKMPVAQFLLGRQTFVVGRTRR